MVWENLTGINVIDIGETASKISSLIILFQAIGGLIIAYLIFNFINIFMNRRRAKDTEKMVKILEQINKKLDKKR